MEQSLPQLILPIKLERSRERLTSLGGLVVLKELARPVGLREEVDRALEGPKSGRGYQPREAAELRQGGKRACPSRYRAVVSPGSGRKSSGEPGGP